MAARMEVSERVRGPCARGLPNMQLHCSGGSNVVLILVWSVIVDDANFGICRSRNPINTMFKKSQNFTSDTAKG